MSRTSELTAIVAILAASAAWHAVSLPWQSLFVDEVAEMEVVGYSASEVWNDPDSMPPLPALLLKAWLGIAKSEAAARWLPALCGLASIVVVWQLGEELSDVRGGVAAAALWAANPLQLYYSQLVRGYALYVLLAAAAMWLFVRALRTDAVRDWAAFAVASAVGMFTHYYFAILLMAAAVVVVIDRHGWPGRLAFAAFVAAGVLSLPVVSCLRTDFEFQRDLREPRPLSAAALGYTYFSFLSGYSLGPSTPELQTMPPRAAAQAALPWAAALAACSGPLFLVGAADLDRRRRLAPMLVFLVAPVLIVGGVGLATGITYNVRHVAWCAVPLTVILGVGAAVAGRRPWGLAAAGGLIGLMLFATYQRNWNPRYQNEDVRAAAAYLDERLGANDVALVVSDYMTPPLRRYSTHDEQFVELPEPGVLSQVIRDARGADSGLQAARERAVGGVTWLVTSRVFHGDPQRLLFARLKQEFRLEQAAAFAGVEIYRSSP